VSIREYDKDHLKQHSGVGFPTPDVLNAPKSDDPLIFWTKHETEAVQISLHSFASGQVKSKTANAIFTPFTGRPHLIRQLAPAIEDRLLGVRPSTATNWMESLRAWWRILDAVEAAAEETGTHMTRVCSFAS
jgi:hypothetical protein